MVALKVESNPIIKYPNSTNQAYYFCVFSMEGRWNVWNPWYLMPKNKLSKVECKFCKNVISYYKDRPFFYLGYQYNGIG
jgi:hypothetical protein